MSDASIIPDDQMGNDSLFHCRVCGLRQADPPWGDDGRTPNFQICDCCGVEFGYEDVSPASVKSARSTWLAKGAPWFNPKARPLIWDVGKQMEAIPEAFK
jgi:hypothetical protein